MTKAESTQRFGQLARQCLRPRRDESSEAGRALSEPGQGHAHFLRGVLEARGCKLDSGKRTAPFPQQPLP